MRLRVAGGVPFINPCLCQLTSGGYQRALPALFSWLPPFILGDGTKNDGGPCRYEWKHLLHDHQEWPLSHTAMPVH